MNLRRLLASFSWFSIVRRYQGDIGEVDCWVRLSMIHRHLLLILMKRSCWPSSSEWKFQSLLGPAGRETWVKIGSDYWEFWDARVGVDKAKESHIYESTWCGAVNNLWQVIIHYLVLLIGADLSSRSWSVPHFCCASQTTIERQRKRNKGFFCINWHMPHIQWYGK